MSEIVKRPFNFSTQTKTGDVVVNLSSADGAYVFRLNLSALIKKIDNSNLEALDIQIQEELLRRKTL